MILGTLMFSVSMNIAKQFANKNFNGKHVVFSRVKIVVLSDFFVSKSFSNYTFCLTARAICVIEKLPEM